MKKEITIFLKKNQNEPLYAIFSKKNPTLGDVLNSPYRGQPLDLMGLRQTFKPLNNEPVKNVYSVPIESFFASCGNP